MANPTLSSMHLSEIIRRCYDYGRKPASEQKANIEARAIDIAIRDVEDAIEQEKSANVKTEWEDPPEELLQELHELQSGKKMLPEIRKSNPQLLALILSRFEVAKAEILMERAKPPLWGLVEGKVFARVAAAIGNVKFPGAVFVRYVWNLSTEQEQHPTSDALVQRIDELDRSLFKDQLLEQIWTDYPEEAGALGLPQPASQMRHSPDYRSVRWFGQKHEFSAKQGACLHVLWEAWENDTPQVSDGTILEKASVGDKQRLRDVFKGHAAWKTMIIPGTHPDTHQLSEPSNKK